MGSQLSGYYFNQSDLQLSIFSVRKQQKKESWTDGICAADIIAALPPPTQGKAYKSTLTAAYGKRVIDERAIYRENLFLSAEPADQGALLNTPNTLMVSEVTVTIKG